MISWVSKPGPPESRTRLERVEPGASVVFTFGSSDDSGAGRMGFYFAREFRRNGWEVIALCQQPLTGASPSVIGRLREIGVVVEIIGPFSGRLDRKVVSRFSEALRRHRAALVVSMHQVDMKFAGLAAREAGVPYVCSGQNTFTFGGSWWKRQLSRRILGWIMNHSCIGVVATSARVEAQFRDLLGYKGPVTIVPNGADTSLGRESVIEREAVRRELGLSLGIRAFVSVGRICEQKNQLGLVEAFAAAFPDSEAVRLVLVGGVTQDRGHLESGRAYEARLERKIRELRMESRVIRTGWREDVPRLLSGGDVYVQASLWEGSPLAVVEAMAAGLPVVMADNGGVLPEFRDSVHGWVVRAGDVASLSVALRQAGTMNTYGLSAAGRKSQELACARYDAQIVAKQFYNWATKFLRLA